MRSQVINAIAIRSYRLVWRLSHEAHDLQQLLKASGAIVLTLALGAQYAATQTLHSFSAGLDGANPNAALVVGNNGVLYGTTQFGGNGQTRFCSGNCGTLFQVTPPSSPGGSWTESVLYSFPTPDGLGGVGEPLSAPAIGANGELYGTTYFGGPQAVGNIYELVPPSSAGGTWTEITLYNFSEAVGDPQNPQAGVAVGKNGVLYGTVEFSGTSPNCPFGATSYGCGAVYSLTPPMSPGGAWTEQTLYTFQGGSDGAVPLAGVVTGKNGELYGATYAGGASSICTAHNLPAAGFGTQASGCGTIFRLDPPASPGGNWTETVIYSFTGGRDGGFPNAVLYHDGLLYGTVTFGGNPRNCGGVGCGGVFRLSPPSASGGAWRESVVYSFSNVPDGLFPAAGVVIDKDGTVYGTTRDGGDRQSCAQNPGCGVVFQLKPPEHPDSQWSEEVLHRFAASDGWRPIAGVVIGKDGNLYGTTYYGGSSTNCLGGCGVVFQVNTKH